jgi:hypothetical protein
MSVIAPLHTAAPTTYAGGARFRKVPKLGNNSNQPIVWKKNEKQAYTQNDLCNSQTRTRG